MIQIPKNVMQIGEINPHTKIYMEDYVHTFLERRKTSEVYLAFGKKEEQNGALYYMIYGVEKKTDWDRGSLPYFRKYDRLGTIQGPAGARTLKPVRADSILLDGYFIFYEQNEDMQAYMIAVRETEEIRGSEEKEAVIQTLYRRGVFNTKGAVREIADALGISEPTVYRYLHKIKTGNDGPDRTEDLP